MFINTLATMNRFIFSIRNVLSLYCPMNCWMYFWLYITNIIHLGDFVSKPQCINADVQELTCVEPRTFLLIILSTLPVCVSRGIL